MGKIFRDMTAEEQAYYDEDSKKFPWLKTVSDHRGSCWGKRQSRALFDHENPPSLFTMLKSAGRFIFIQ